MTIEDSTLVKKEVQKQIRVINEQSKKVNATKKTALAFLVRAGICTKNGRLTTRYR